MLKSEKNGENQRKNQKKFSFFLIFSFFYSCTNYIKALLYKHGLALESKEC